jgi:serine/threonine protein phosphatase PrpC
MRVTAATLPGGSRNQDAHAVLANAAIVLDGASSFSPDDDPRDGGWYAAQLLAELAPRVTDASQPLTRCLRDAITVMRDEHGATIGGPSSTVLIARWSDTRLELLILGDSYAVIECQNGRVDTITDHRLTGIAPETRRKYQSRLATGHGMDEQHRALLSQLQTAQRKRRNRPRGYWIAEADPGAAAKALTRTIPLSTTARLLLATDGAAAAVEDYHSSGGWDEYLNVIGSSPGQALIDICRLEETDPDGERWPRAKRHDDKTVALLET